MALTPLPVASGEIDIAVADSQGKPLAHRLLFWLADMIVFVMIVAIVAGAAR